MADLSELSNEELLAIVQSDAAPALDMSQLSNEQLISIANGEATEDWNPVDSAKQFGAGAIEGTAGFAGLLNDLNPMTYPARLTDLAINSEARAKPWNEILFPSSTLIQKGLDQVLPEKQDQYRYSRTAGQFVGPSVVGKANAGWSALKEIPTALSAAFGAQLSEDATGDKKIAPVFGALAGGGAASLAGDAAKLVRTGFVGATADEIQGAAAKSLRDQTGLTSNELSAALKTQPADDLGNLMSTAELTNNAGMAQIEKDLASTGQRANLYNERSLARNDARDAMLDSMSNVSAVNREGLGTNLIEAGKATRDTLDENSRKLWNEVPRHAPIDVDYAQSDLAYILASRQGGLKPGSKVMTLVDQFMEPGPKSSGALQDIRSDALALSRDANLSPFETRILGELDSGIVKSMNGSLSGDSANAWQAAREATAEAKGTFARGTAGGSLVEPTARPANVLQNAIKGDTQSIEEIRAALATKPELMEDVKRGFLDMVPRDAQGRVTANGMKKFISANEGSIKELLGPQHYDDMRRILEDLQSEARVGRIAFKASEGNSVTAQRQTVAGALEDAVLTSLTPGSPFVAKIVERVKQGQSIQDAEAVRELLFKAAMDPKFALMLSQTPTKARILNATERLFDAGYNLKDAALKGSVLELSRTESNLPFPDGYGRNGQGKDAAGRTREGQPQSQREESARQPSQRSQSTASQGLPEMPPSSSPQSSTSTASEGTEAGRTSQGRTDDRSASIASVPSGDPALSAVFSPVNYTSAIDEVFGNNMAAPDPKLVQAVVRQESGGKADAVSPKGAVGLMQMTPVAAKEIQRVYGWDASKFNPRDPDQNMKWGTKYLELMLDTFGDTKLALAAYNAGPTAVAKLVKRYGNSFDAIQPHLPRETQLYVPAIISHYSKPPKSQVVKV